MSVPVLPVDYKLLNENDLLSLHTALKNLADLETEENGAFSHAAIEYSVSMANMVLCRAIDNRISALVQTSTFQKG